MTFSRIFLRCLIARIVLAAIFSWIGYIGSGGDAQIYHLLGVLVKERFYRGEAATLDEVVQKWGWNDPEPILYRYWGVYWDAINRSYTGTFINNTTPAVYLHAVLYAVWEHPFIYVLFTSVLSALTTAYFIRAFELPREDHKWAVYNPVSMFYASTHYKESIVESLLLMVIALWYRVGHHFRAAIFASLIALFRIAYLPLLVLIYAYRWIARIRLPLLVVSLMIALIILPSFYWQYPAGETGAIYSLVHRNEFTKRALGPIVGLVQPVPFLDPPNTIPGAFATIYGFFYLYILGSLVLFVLLVRKQNQFVGLSLVIAILVSYYTLGTAAAKARYFAPFLPIMILAFLQTRKDTKRAILRLLVPRVFVPRRSAMR